MIQEKENNEFSEIAYYRPKIKKVDPFKEPLAYLRLNYLWGEVLRGPTQGPGSVRNHLKQGGSFYC